MYLLAIPYQGENDILKKARFKAACDVIQCHGEGVFCPMIYEHTLKEVNGEEPKTGSLYSSFMRTANGLFVYQLPGWQADPVVNDLINFFSLTKQTVTYLEPLPQHMTGAYAEVWNRFL